MLINKIKKALSVESIRRVLSEYFQQKEVDMNDHVYPPLLRDIGQQVPMLANKVEIKPYIEDIDPTTNYVKIGWNLFVLGTHRLFLGYSVHESLAHLDVQITDPLFVGEAEPMKTPIQIIQFIVHVLGEHKMGRPYQSEVYKKPPMELGKLPSNANNSYYEKNKLQASSI